MEEMKWISVKDELPDRFQYVLVCFEGNERMPYTVSMARYVNYDCSKWELEGNTPVCIDSQSWYLTTCDITHWMPLPFPPKD